MEPKPSALAIDLMLQFADLTGLRGAGKPPRRYLWTDAFAVCNFLELFRLTQEKRYRDLALRLVEQVHQTLGRHREDDPRSGWISGLDEEEGKQHPTLGGLRIGKKLPELQPDEPVDERLEWDRDGQYYHYLTKWMHALNRVSRVTGDPACHRWGAELAKTAHSRFLYGPPGQQRMYWKMSIDLSRPLVPAMGQHDPLDGLVTCSELQAADGERTASPALDLGTTITDLALLCRGQNLVTDDPLGIGGLLFDASRMSQLRAGGHLAEVDLLAPVLEAAERGLEAFSVRSPLRLQPIYRLPFRELGLAIGLRAFGKMRPVIESNPDRFDPSLRKRTESLRRYEKFREPIENFWSEGENQKSERWLEHREINMVMLATSLESEGFLAI
ncbi:MAG: hypothetical protein IH614_08435 [Desulfuromonadales bacterium]|nr:hypothetical protein [Desulfuromonadales bacterium]